MADIDNQPRKDLSSTEAIEKIKEIATAANICMFHTAVGNFPDHATPMAIQGVCTKGNLYFLSSSDNEKNVDIQKDDRVMLSFMNSGKYEYLTIYGHASIHKDNELIEKYWTKMAEVWFEGKDDPKLTVIRVTPFDGHYWETKNGKIVTGLKMLFAAITGAKTEDGGIEGDLKV